MPKWRIDNLNILGVVMHHSFQVANVTTKRYEHKLLSYKYWLNTLLWLYVKFVKYTAQGCDLANKFGAYCQRITID